MKIEGKIIAAKIEGELKEKVKELLKKGITPHLSIILVGDDPSSLAYVHRKKRVGERLGVKVTIYKKKANISQKKFLALINKLNNDKLTHGIIIQRPLPLTIEDLDTLVLPKKDVDGFHPHSPFTPPIALAVLKILENIFLSSLPPSTFPKNKDFLNWLREKKVLIIGRGETGGKPVAKTFKKMGIPFQVAHRQTLNLKKLCLSAKIIISCVGKPNIVRPTMVTADTILVGIGLHLKGKEIQADYDQAKIEKKVAFYTPVPGGVGPVNVACLFANLLKATHFANKSYIRKV